jgi:hypothetical protein
VPPRSEQRGRATHDVPRDLVRHGSVGPTQLSACRESDRAEITLDEVLAQTVAWLAVMMSPQHKSDTSIMDDAVDGDPTVVTGGASSGAHEVASDVLEDPACGVDDGRSERGGRDGFLSRRHSADRGGMLSPLDLAVQNFSARPRGRTGCAHVARTASTRAWA